MKKRVILIGAGGFGREVISWANDAYKAGIFPAITSYLDDNSGALDGFPYDFEYLGSVNAYIPCADDSFILGIGSVSTKRKIVDAFFSSLDRFLTLVHPTAVIAPSANIGRGVVVCPFALVSADTQIGDFVTINAMSSVGHDSVIGRFSTLSGHVDVTGQVHVGEEVFFGSGARVVPRIKIGSNAKIGAGCTVMRSVNPGVTYFTLPAKKLL